MTTTTAPAATTRLDLSADAYTSRNFDRIFNTFRPSFPEGFRFTVTASWQNPTGDCPQVTTLTAHADFAAEIIAALEAGK